MKKMTLEQALQRIGELEFRVAELEKRPAIEYHYHTHYAPVAPYPALVPQPQLTPGFVPHWTPAWITIGAAGLTGAAGGVRGDQYRVTNG